MIAETPRKSAADRLHGWKRYWDEERETMPRAQRERVILDRIKHQLEYAYNRLPFYRRHYERHGFKPEMVRTLEDFTTKVPVITKKMLVEDQAEHPPFGSYVGIERDQIGRVHGSSGTMGTPTMYAVSQKDWQRCGEVSAMGLWCAGLRPDDLIQITFPFTLFFGGWGFLQAAELMGAGCFPSGTMVTTERQIELMKKLGSTALVATPSYIVHLGNRARELGVDVAQESAITIAVMGGEPGGSIPSVRDQMREIWGEIPLIDGAPGSTSEMYPFLMNIGCLEHGGEHGGGHLFTDENYTEVVDKDDPNVPVPAGTSGATVGTHLWRESQPMIRFWMGDEGVLDDSPCPCGRTYPRLPKGVYGRLDDMLLIRGANVYPSAVEAVVRGVEGAGGEFRIFVDRPGDLDEMTVEVERAPEISEGQVDGLRDHLERDLKAKLGIRIPVTIVEPGTHEVQTFKARRVVDRRPKR